MGKKEPYEKPTVERLDLGEQIRQARSLLTRVRTRTEEIRNLRDGLEGRIGSLEGEMASLSVDVELLDRLTQRIDLILELQESRAVGAGWVGNDDRRKP